MFVKGTTLQFDTQRVRFYASLFIRDAFCTGITILIVTENTEIRFADNLGMIITEIGQSETYSVAIGLFRALEKMGVIGVWVVLSTRFWNPLFAAGEKPPNTGWLLDEASY